MKFNLLKFWNYTPLGFLTALVLTLCESFKVRAPFAPVLFGLAIGAKPVKVQVKHANPVKCVLGYFKMLNPKMHFDLASFQRIAELVGDCPTSKGFVIDSMQSLGRICQEYDFIVVFVPNEDLARCMTVDEFEKVQKEFKG